MISISSRLHQYQSHTLTQKKLLLSTYTSTNNSDTHKNGTHTEAARGDGIVGIGGEHGGGSLLGHFKLSSRAIQLTAAHPQPQRQAMYHVLMVDTFGIARLSEERGEIVGGLDAFLMRVTTHWMIGLKRGLQIPKHNERLKPQTCAEEEVRMTAWLLNTRTERHLPIVERLCSPQSVPSPQRQVEPNLATT